MDLARDLNANGIDQVNSNSFSDDASAGETSKEKTPCENPVTFPISRMNIQSFIHDPKERLWSGPFTFIIMADPQFGLLEKYYLQKENPKWDEEIRITKAAIEQINQLHPKPKFLMICGDMLDTRPESEAEQAIRKEQYQDFIHTFQILDPDIKIVVCAGNHDVGDIPTIESLEIYHEQFGPDFFTFWVNGVKFIILNSQYWKSPSSIPIHFQEQEKFLSTILESKGKHSIVCQHYPFFISHPEEDDIGFLNIEKKYRFQILEQLRNAGVKYIFCGHYHKNGGGFYKDVEQVVTSALCNPLGDDPCGFRIVSVEDEKVTSQFVGIEAEQNNTFSTIINGN